MMKCCGLCECFDCNNKSGQSSFSNKEPDYDDGNKDIRTIIYLFWYIKARDKKTL